MKKAVSRIYAVMLSLLFVTFLFVSAVHAQDALQLEVVYPKQDAEINAYSTFFVGHTNPGAKLRINNRPVKVYPNGGFVQVVELNPGTNVINLQSVLNGEFKKVSTTVYTPKYKVTTPKYPLKIESESVSPTQNSVCRVGDLIQVSFKGATGNKAYFSIGNKRRNIPMVEQPPKHIQEKPVYGSYTVSSYAPVKGIYKGTYRIKINDKFKNEPITVKLVSDRDKVTLQLPAKVSTISPDDPPFIAKVRTNYATVRTYPGKSRLTPLPEGTFINLTGKKGDNYRFQLGQNMNGWVHKDDIQILPEGTPVWESNIDIIDIVSQPERVFVNIPLSQRQPIIIDQLSANTMTLKIFGVTANIDLFSYEKKDKFLKEVKWTQDTKDSVKINLKVDSSQFWGYRYYYDNNY